MQPLRDSARKQYPSETLSRGEIMRRLSLAGIETLKNVSHADRARLAHGFQASMEAGDARLKH